jgi:hypothetical protein
MNEANKLRSELLDAINDAAKGPSPNLQAGTILGKFRSSFQNLEREQVLLTLWHDLFRTGYLAWGHNLQNADPPFFHLTGKGRRWLEHFSRDPLNPTGYLAYVATQAKLNPVALAYLAEAVKTYNNDCIKSSVVMTGAAAECIALDLRDVLVAKIETTGGKVPNDLDDQRIKKVLDAMERLLDMKKADMPPKLREAFESHWPPIVHQIRRARNDAGHPKNIDAVEDEIAHASLLIFPELAKLYSDLSSWVSNSYT